MPLTLSGVPVQQLEDVLVVHQFPHDGNLRVHMLGTDTSRKQERDIKPELCD